MIDLAALSASYHAAASRLIALDMLGWILFPSIILLVVAIGFWAISSKGKP